jgi:hypothetical protein
MLRSFKCSGLAGPERGAQTTDILTLLILLLLVDDEAVELFKVVESEVVLVVVEDVVVSPADERALKLCGTTGRPCRSFACSVVAIAAESLRFNKRELGDVSPGFRMGTEAAVAVMVEQSWLIDEEQEDCNSEGARAADNDD